MNIVKSVSGVKNVTDRELRKVEDVPAYLREVQVFLVQQLSKILKERGVDEFNVRNVRFVTRDLFDKEMTIEVRATWGPEEGSPVELFGGRMDGMMLPGHTVGWDDDGFPEETIQVPVFEKDAAPEDEIMVIQHELVGIRVTSGQPHWVYKPVG
jgi:hypothetical protein